MLWAIKQPTCRFATGLLRRALSASPVVVLMGTRQTGKSTLVQHEPLLRDRFYLTLDDSETRERARTPPRRRELALSSNFYSMSRRTRLSCSGVPMSIQVPVKDSPLRVPSAAARKKRSRRENGVVGELAKRDSVRTAMPQ